MSWSKLISSRRSFVLSAILAGFVLPVAPATDAYLIESYGKLPLQFEENQGQTDQAVRFLSRGPGYSLYLTAGEAVLVLAKAGSQAQSLALRMRLVGANSESVVSGLDELPGKANYFIGKDPAKWPTNVPTYAKVHYQNVYPGIDLLYYGNQRQLEYDFVVAAGAYPEQIGLSVEGADKIEIDAQGNLVLQVAGGEIRQHKPVIYQEIDGVRHEVSGGYAIRDENRIGFDLAAYDTSRPLVIDPVLSYSTFLGGSDSDVFAAIAVDGSGATYVIGNTGSSDFPTTPGAFETSFKRAFVTKLDATGSALVYSTFLGGGGNDGAVGVAVDATGAAYVTGSTTSSDFPTTVGAFDTRTDGFTDAFVTKLDSTGSALVYSTYLGGAGGEQGSGIAVDATGAAYVIGVTFSSDFPTNAGAFDRTFGGGDGQGGGDAFVTKLNPAGSALAYSTYLGGNGGDESFGIAVDAMGSAYVTGSTRSTNFPVTAGAFDSSINSSSGDAFVTKLDATGSALAYSTYLGGASGSTAGRGIAVDTTGFAYVTGDTSSSDFPTTPGAFDTRLNGFIFTDSFVTKLDATGSALVYSTYLGGSRGEQGFGIAVDVVGAAYVTGYTSSNDFPTTPGAFDTSFNGDSDAFVTKLDATGSALVYSTFLGGSDFEGGRGIAVDATGAVYVTGHTPSSDFPTTAGAFDTSANGLSDVFIARLALGAALLVIDKDSIDDGNAPSFFSDLQVNNDVAAIGVRAQLRFFQDQVGQTITLATGQVGGEGWFGLKTIPTSWVQAGGIAGYVGNPAANPEDPPPHGTGPGLGAPDAHGDPDSLLKSVPNVTPLRATALNNLIGRMVCAIVYDNQVGVNYDQHTGKLKGANLGTVAFQLMSVAEVYSAPALPNVAVRIRDARTECKGPFALLTDAEAPTEPPPPPQ